jgi:hypothetical protein
VDDLEELVPVPELGPGRLGSDPALAVAVAVAQPDHHAACAGRQAATAADSVVRRPELHRAAERLGIAEGEYLIK